MPRPIELGVPFESRISPDFERAATRHLDWPCSFGLLTTEHARRRHIRACYPDLASRFQPKAVGDDLDLSVDQQSWYFIFDDHFDGPGGHPTPAQALVSSVQDALDHPPGPDAEPIVQAFYDLWKRTRSGMSPAWQARAADNWRTYLAGCVEESLVRHQGRPLTIDRYLQMRRKTIGVGPVLDLAERVGHFELPAQVLTSDPMTRVQRLATELVIIQNDIWSVEKEEQAGDVNNVVLILTQESSRPEAIETAYDMFNERMVEYPAAEHALSAFSESLDPETRSAIDRYIVDGVRSVVQGNYHWSELSGRYGPVQQAAQASGEEPDERPPTPTPRSSRSPS